ncbi:MAG: hypothetical protein H0X24_15895 [Ktedonobacterales bacterium]|nr:hypothetical protein [Ktedonobacterales bacterium]
MKLSTRRNYLILSVIVTILSLEFTLRFPNALGIFTTAMYGAFIILNGWAYVSALRRAKAGQ